MKLFNKPNFLTINNTLTFTFLLAAFLFTACGGQETKDAASTTSAAINPVAEQKVTGEKYTIDTKESEITWYGSMLITSKGSHHGFINISKGELLIEKGGKLVGGTVEVDMNTIADEGHGTNNNLVDHLKSADFFEVEKFPYSTFAVIMVTSAKGDTVNVTGSLNIKGITRTVTFPAIIEVKDNVLNAHGKLSIDRSQFDVRYKSRAFGLAIADDLISDTIEFEIKLVGRR